MHIYVVIIFIIAAYVIYKYFFNYKYNHNNIEHYDDRLKGMTFEQCANKCKTIENCYGFGFDKNNNICYISESIIDGRPVRSIFKDEYLYSNATCNKVQPIISPEKNPVFSDRRSNSVYVCRENDNMQPSYYFHNKGQFTPIGEGKNIDSIFNVDFYSIEPYTWPINNYSVSQVDLVYKAIENQTFTPENVTDVSRITSYKAQPIEIIKNTIEQVIPKTGVKLDFGLE